MTKYTTATTAAGVMLALATFPSCSGSSGSNAVTAIGGNSGAANAAGGASGSAGGAANAASGAAGSAGAVERGDQVFSDQYVVEYRLTIAAADEAFLEEHGNEETYVPATLTVRGDPFGTVELGKIGVRHKGDTTLQPCWATGVRSYANQCARLSYKLSFNEYVTETRLFGLKHLHLNVSYSDPSRLRELLAHHIFADFGVPTARAAPAALFVNEELVGLFIAIEDIDGRFTAMHFPNGGNGNLYKEAWPRAGQPDSYFLAALRTNEGAAANVSDMQQFSQTVATLNEANVETAASRLVDIESLLRYLAVDRAIKNWDGITAFYNPEGPHNFYFYHDDGPESRFHLIPWDFNGAATVPGVFVDSDPYMDPHPGQNIVPNVNVAPASCGPISLWNVAGDLGMEAPGCDPLLRYLVQTQWDRWASMGRELLNGPLSADLVQSRIDALSALIAPVIKLDPAMQYSAWGGAVQLLPGVIAENRSAFERLLAEGYRVE